MSVETKMAIAKKLSTVKPLPYNKGYPSPVPLEGHSKRAGLALRLTDFVGRGSLFMFDVLGFGKQWLKLHPNQWSQDPAYLEMRRFVDCLLPTNDAAERGIKLVSDYANSLTKDPDQKQFLLQVVEQSRRECPDVSKKTLAKAFQLKK